MIQATWNHQGVPIESPPVCARHWIHGTNFAFNEETDALSVENHAPGVNEVMRQCDEVLQRTLELVDLMAEIADQGDEMREDVGCGVLYGVLRDSAYKIKKLAEGERQAHIRKGWWKESKAKEA